MKVIVAMDSFKGSLSSLEAGIAVKEGIQRAKPDAEVTVKPLADGGEGTVDALLEGLGGEKIILQAYGPMGSKVTASYGLLPGQQTAVMEMASVCGLTLVPEECRNPLTANTFGLGEMILDALDRGVTEFIIGIGGSATNDGGMGMLHALGYEFTDENNQVVEDGGGFLYKIKKISDKNVRKELKNCHFRIACDVVNPLYGAEGATYTFGPQKGAGAPELEILEEGMINFAEIAAGFTGKDQCRREGAGAAGGLGFAFLSFLDGKLCKGINLIMEAVGLEGDIREADYVITGEGRLDGQTAMGKAPAGVAGMAKKYGRKVIAFAGCVTRDARECNNYGIDGYFPTVRGITTLEEAMRKENAIDNIKDTVEQVFRLLP